MPFIGTTGKSQKMSNTTHHNEKKEVPPTGTSFCVNKPDRAKRCVTAIYGGSFNPIHLGHTSLGEWLCDEGLVDELWFLVSPQNPHKVGDTSLLDDDIRLQLAQLAVEESERLHVSDFEMHLPRPSYMVHTLARLRESYPEREFVLVIGADNWARFNQWYKPEEIMAHHRIIIYPREGYPIDASALPSGVTLVHSPLYPISSTDIRQAIANGTCQGEWLHPNVWREIQQRSLYI